MGGVGRWRRAGGGPPELVALGAASFGAYLATLAPSVSWRHGGDGAELAAAAYVWGVAHPPGYPVYLTLVRAFQLLPIGDPAYRANLFSAAAAAAAAVLVSLATLELLRASDRRPDGWERVGALFAGAAFALAPLLWSHAVIAEVYSFTAALFGLFLLSAGRWTGSPTPRRSLLVGGSLALMAAHHPPLGVALLPVAGLARRWALPGGAWLRLGAPLALAPLLLLSEWVRASLDPPLSWGEPDAPDRWLAQVTAAIYRPYFLSAPAAEELARLPAAVALLVRQGGWLAVALAALGLAWLWQRRRGAALVACSLAGFFVAFAVLYNARDGAVYLIPAAEVLAVAAGVGATQALRELPPAGRWLGSVALTASVGWQLWAGWPEVDASHERGAREWGERVLAGAPADGVVRSTEDEHTFVLWYLQSAEGLRPDVAIVDERLARLSWYRQQLVRRYPRLAGQGIADEGGAGR